MDSNLMRDDFILLLDRMKSEDKEEVLEVVGEVHDKMLAANVTWDDLLRLNPDEGEVISSDKPVGQDEVTDNREAEAGEIDLSTLDNDEVKEAEALILSIQKLKISENTKKELEEYLVDLKEDEFHQMDLRYLRALKSRLVS